MGKDQKMKAFVIPTAKSFTVTVTETNINLKVDGLLDFELLGLLHHMTNQIELAIESNYSDKKIGR